MIKLSFWIWTSTICFLLAGCPGQPVTPTAGTKPESQVAGAEDAAAPSAQSFFTVDHYDPARDAIQDLQQTTRLASSSGKRILLEVGGKW